MIAPGGSNGEDGPKSNTNPVSLDVLWNVTVVPTFTQKGPVLFASGMLGTADAELLPLRLISTTQAVVLDPHVVLALHILPGFVSEQRYLSLLFFCSWAVIKPAKRRNSDTKAVEIATRR